MSGKWQGRLIVGVLVVVAGGGCSPLQLWSMIAYSSNGSEVAPEHMLPVHKDPATGFDKEMVKVVVMVSTPRHVNSEFIGADRTLASLLHKELEHYYKSSKWKIDLVPPGKIDEFLRTQPSSVSAGKVGQHFDADYVIDIEVTGLTMFEPGTLELYKGRGQVSVVVHDVVEATEFTQFEYASQYPSYGPVMRGPDVPASTFRQNFLKNMAMELSWKFAPHLREDEEITTGRGR